MNIWTFGPDGGLRCGRHDIKDGRSVVTAGRLETNSTLGMRNAGLRPCHPIFRVAVRPVHSTKRLWRSRWVLDLVDEEAESGAEQHEYENSADPLPGRLFRFEGRDERMQRDEHQGREGAE